MWRWLGVGAALLGGVPVLRAQVPELSLPRPGAVVVSALMGEAAITTGEARWAIKADERLRVGSTLTTGRKSLLTLTLSNGAAVELGPDSEIELEEFGQEPFAGSIKFQELKEEPTLSRTRVRLVRGEVTVEVKPLKVSRGSSFVVMTPAGNARTGGGSLHAMVRMADVGLGVCSVEVKKGAAEFELPGTTFAPLAIGKKRTYALEVDTATGAVKVGEMPTAAAPTK